MKNIKKLITKSILFTIVAIIPILSFAAISEQAKTDFQYIYGTELKPEIYNNILNFCEKNDTDINSCLLKLKAQSSEQKPAAGSMRYHQCCWNVSGQLGEYVYVYGQSYCVPNDFCH